MAQTVSILSWERFQHYKDRDPPWVKLYRDLLTTESWVLGTDLSRLVQVASILLAARYNNAIPLQWNLIRKVTSLACSEKQFVEAINYLASTKFLQIQDAPEEVNGVVQVASNSLAICSSEQSRAEKIQSREDTEQRRADMAGDPPRVRRVVSHETDPDWFLDFKLAYPERAGDQGWREAIRQAKRHLCNGHTAEELIAGAKRYAAFCEAEGNTGTRFVKQAKTFLGPDKHFLLPWQAPPKAETATERLMRLNSETDESMVIEHDPTESFTISRQ